MEEFSFLFNCEKEEYGMELIRDVLQTQEESRRFCFDHCNIWLVHEKSIVTTQNMSDRGRTDNRLRSPR